MPSNKLLKVEVTEKGAFESMHIYSGAAPTKLNTIHCSERVFEAEALNQSKSLKSIVHTWEISFCHLVIEFCFFFKFLPSKQNQTELTITG